MNFRNFRIKSYSLLTAGLLAGFGSSIHADQTVAYVPGTTCKPANLTQAFDLSWNHYRVLNPLSNSFDRWVVCPSGYMYVQDSGGYMDTTGVGTFHEGPGNILCIIRKYPPQQTTAAVPFQSQTWNSVGPYPAGDRRDFSDANIKGFGARSVTCRLSPGTGINMLLSYGN